MINTSYGYLNFQTIFVVWRVLVGLVANGFVSDLLGPGLSLDGDSIA